MSGALLSRVPQEYSEDCPGFGLATLRLSRGRSVSTGEVIEKMAFDGNRWQGKGKGKDGIGVNTARPEQPSRQLSKDSDAA